MTGIQTAAFALAAGVGLIIATGRAFTLAVVRRWCTIGF